MKGNGKMRFATGLLCAFALFAFGLADGAVTPMASQPWVRMTVSNAVNTATSNTKEWVKKYVSVGEIDAPPTDRETMVWYEDGALKWKRNGKIVSHRIKSIDFGKTTKGYYVTKCNNTDGIVTNGMVYAWVGGGDFKCPGNDAIPLIRYNGLVTNTTDGVVYVYQKFKITEKHRKPNGTYVYVDWNMVQATPRTWRCYRTESADEGYEFREFVIVEATVAAIPETPDVALHKGFIERALGVALDLLVPSASAGIEVGDFSSDTMSGTLEISLDGIDSPFTFSLSFGGSLEYQTPDPPREDWTEDKDDKEIIHHYKWDPNPWMTSESWCNVNNWFDSVYNCHVKEWNDFDQKYEEYDVPISLTEIVDAAGSSIQSALAASYKASQEVEWTEEKDKDCSKGVHEFNDDTCVCVKCKAYDRGHSDMRAQVGDCHKCKLKRGKFNVSTGKTIEDYGTYCDGRKSGEEYHVGWYADPFTELLDPPGSNGSSYDCSCTCGYYSPSKNRHQHSFSDYETPKAGDLNGNDEDAVHTLVYKCTRCANSEEYGWKATVEAHKVDESEDYEVFSYSVEDDPYGKSFTNVDPPTTYPDNRESGINESYHCERGKCEKCRHNVDTGLIVHTFDENCTCSCGFQKHTFEQISCPHAAHCTTCGKWFYKDDNGYVIFADVDKDEHVCNIQIGTLEDGDIDMEYHKCACHDAHPDYVKTIQEHNWQDAEDEYGNMNKQCQDGEPGEKDSNGNPVLGCKLWQHNVANCPMNSAVGTCGNWTCPVCGKSLNVDKDGNAAPMEHAPCIHSGSTKECDHYGPTDDTSDEKYHCAVCKHTWLGSTCGTVMETYYDESGKKSARKRYDGHVLDEAKLHIDWKKSKDSEDSAHDCKCRREDEDGVLGHHRSHNWNITSITYKDEDLHNVKKTCDAVSTSDDKPFFDNCGHSVNKDEMHTWRDPPSSFGLLYSDVNGECKKNRKCRVYDANGVEKGCGAMKQESATHDWKFLSELGDEDRWTCGTGANIEMCYRHRKCEHGTAESPKGCGAMNYKYPDRHEKNYGNASEQITGDSTYHNTRVRCDHSGCDYNRTVQNRHNFTTTYVYQNTEKHQRKDVCDIDKDKNPHCGYEKTDYPQESHHVTIRDTEYYSNVEHRNHNYCDKCKEWYYDKYTEHAGYFRHIWDGYKYMGINWGQIVLIGDPTGEHSKSNYCGKCDSWYYGGEDCDYHNTSDWTMNDDNLGDGEEAKGYDEAYCELCNTTSRLPHVYHPISEDLHWCQHKCGGGWSPGHLIGDHEYGIIPGSYEWGCTICGYKPPYSAQCPDCPDCCYVVNDSAHCLWGWNYDNDKCGCPYCQGEKTKYTACWCATAGRFIYKITDPIILGSTYKYCLRGDQDVEGVDGDDPVYEIGEYGFYGAFMECPKLTYVHFNKATNVMDSGCYDMCDDDPLLSYVGFDRLERMGEYAFESAFSRCESLNYVNFRSLKEIGGYAFEMAFDGCTSLTNIAFPSVESIGERAFAWAFPYSGMTNSFGLAFPKVKWIDDGAFKDYPFGGVSFDGLRVIEGGCFGRCFTSPLEESQDCYITNVTFKGVKEIRSGAFNSTFGGSVVSRVSFPDVISVGSNAFVTAFSGYEGDVSFPALTNVGARAFTDAFVGCASTNIDFSATENVGDMAFAGAFIDCNPTNVTFGALKNVGYRSFYKAFGKTEDGESE